MNTRKADVTEMMTEAEVNQLRELREMIAPLMDLDFDKMRKLADIKMVREAWNMFGTDDGDNGLLKGVMKLAMQVRGLNAALDETRLTRIQTK